MEQKVASEEETMPGVGSGELAQLVADVRLLASEIRDASARLLVGTVDLERTTKNLVSHIETFPGRIADAIAEALAEQHRMIVMDVQSALRDLASRPASQAET